MQSEEFQKIRTDSLKLTMPQLARALRVTVQDVQNWDSGRQAPPGPVQVVMRAAIDIPALRTRLRRLSKLDEGEPVDPPA